MTRQRWAFVAVGAAAIVVVAAAIALGPRPAAPSGSPSPTAAIASPTATPSPSPTATATAAASPTVASTPTAAAGAPADGRYGVIVQRGNSFDLVTETGTVVQQVTCGTASCNERGVAASFDGKRVAHWRAGQAAGWELRVFESATPANARTVVTLPSTFRGGALAWASDGQGVLYAAQTVENFPGIGGGPRRATISAVDLTTPQAPGTDVMPARTEGAVYIPVAWDRAKKIFAAALTGEGGFIFEYAVSDASGHRATRTTGELVAFSVEGSPDATRVLAIGDGLASVRIWPVTNFAAQVAVRPPGGRILAARWRTANEVGWTFGARFDVFVPQTDTSRTVFTGSGDVRLLAFRPDGTGALIAQQSGRLIVDMQTGATTPTPVELAVPFAPRGVLLR